MSESIHLARLTKSGHHFEIDVDADKAMEFKQGTISDIRDVLQVEKIFADAKKGLEASEHDMDSLFGTHDPLEVAKIIIQEGEIQLTEEYRRKQRELKLKQIVQIIKRNGVDPKTHLPHPETRIMNAIEQTKVKIDDRRPEDQVQDVLKQLRTVLPIKFEIKDIQVRIPAEYGAKAYSQLQAGHKVLSTEWQSDGSLLVKVEVPGGLETEFYEKINSLTQGNNDCKVLNIKE